MPNTPGQIGEGITGYLFASKPNAEEGKHSENSSSIWKFEELNEEVDLDRVTAISEGPAYIFEFTSALKKQEKKLAYLKKMQINLPNKLLSVRQNSWKSVT